MKNIKILGAGCKKCGQLAELTEATAKAAGIPYTLEKITDLRQIMQFNVMRTPALVIDGVVKTNGTIPTVDEITQYLQLRKN